jgi:putative transposase
MARSPRLFVTGHALHIARCGDNRATVFFQNRDYQRYLKILRDAAKTYVVAIHAYAFMPGHVRLLDTPSDKSGPSRMMQSIGLQYARYIVDAYHRNGSLWEERFKSSVIDSGDYFLACSQFIEQTAVRENLVQSAGQYRWSSFHANAKGISDPILSQHPEYESLGRDRSNRIENYRGRFADLLEPKIIDFIERELKNGASLEAMIFEDMFNAMRNPVSNAINMAGTDAASGFVRANACRLNYRQEVLTDQT